MELFVCEGGSLLLPDPLLVLVDRLDGGHLIVNPPRKVWERSELTAAELSAWSMLIAAAGRAMLDALPLLADGCINYWEAGNWSLHHDARPAGAKLPRDARQVHLHLLGRSRFATSPNFAWGEAPRFPPFNRRHEWAATPKRLQRDEYVAVLDALEERLHAKYRMHGKRMVEEGTTA